MGLHQINGNGRKSLWDLVNPDDTIELKLGDKERHLYYGRNAVEHFRRHYRETANGNLLRAIIHNGEMITSSEDGSIDVDISKLTDIIHSGLITEDNTLTRAEVGDLVWATVTDGNGYRSAGQALAAIVWEAATRARILRRIEAPAAEKSNGEGPLDPKAEAPEEELPAKRKAGKKSPEAASATS